MIHSAAAYKDPVDWASDAETNVRGTINVGQAAQRLDVAARSSISRPRFAMAARIRFRSPWTIRPVRSPSYGISKTAGEQYLQMTGLPVVSLRLANVTGPRLAIGPIPTFYQRLKAGKSCFCSETVRDFLDMDDFFSLMDKALVPGAATGIFNVSTGEGHTIKDVFNAVVGVFPNAATLYRSYIVHEHIRDNQQRTWRYSDWPPDSRRHRYSNRGQLQGLLLVSGSALPNSRDVI
ncbi:NAD-dependent epimerase/dehydratase family protein [Pyruvatibacter mobilis]|uniref:NAD-dependent epimerase/dehydratase family protein n=1 Tax=Pyruvatibacter mobilis TaxID=1712261 RepID=UPI001963D463|nr:NAD-dependent epimerase/dehydratase family protein [Pyruvatibacter mobilis]